MTSSRGTTGAGLSARGSFERHVIAVPADENAEHYNNYLLVSTATRDAALIDAAGDPSATLQTIQAHRARVRMILLTHGHSGHWHALGRLREALGVPIGIHLGDVDMLPLTPNFALGANQRIAFGTANLTVLHTPGHTPGSVCLLGDGNLFSGDTLLAGKPATLSVMTGDGVALAQSTRDELLALRDTVLVFPGHGAPTSIGAERARLSAWAEGTAP